jgi:hypothetical protein
MDPRRMESGQIQKICRGQLVQLVQMAAMVKVAAMVKMEVTERALPAFQQLLVL